MSATDQKPPTTTPTDPRAEDADTSAKNGEPAAVDADLRAASERAIRKYREAFRKLS